MGRIMSEVLNVGADFLKIMIGSPDNSPCLIKCVHDDFSLHFVCMLAAH